MGTEIGDVELKIPRDHNRSFESATVPVGQRRLSGLDQMVISLYAKELARGDIAKTHEGGGPDASCQDLREG